MDCACMLNMVQIVRLEKFENSNPDMANSLASKCLWAF